MKTTALYCRISQEDALNGDSQSIESQKLMLTQYVEKHNLPKPKFYVELETQLSETNSLVENAEKFLKTISRYVDVPTLDKGILNEVIDRIDVHTGEGKRNHRVQLVEIHWRFIGTVDKVVCGKENR